MVMFPKGFLSNREIEDRSKRRTAISNGLSIRKPGMVVNPPNGIARKTKGHVHRIGKAGPMLR